MENARLLTALAVGMRPGCNSACHRARSLDYPHCTCVSIAAAVHGYWTGSA
jgi:hypothetical protein